MTRPKTLLLLAFLVTLTILTPRLTANAARGEGDDGKLDDAPLAEQLRAAFANVTPSNVPTGILLQAGSVFFDQHIQQLDGTAQEGRLVVTPDMLRNTYFDLSKGALFTEMPTLAELNERAATVKTEHGVVPLALTVIDYDTIPDEYLTEDYFVDGIYVPRTNGPIGETRRFVASAPMADTAYGPPVTFILPSELVVGNGISAENIQSLSIAFDGEEPLRITLDEPFEVYRIHPDANSNFNYTLTFDLNGREVNTRGGGEVTTRGGAGDCYDLDPVSGTIPYNPENPIGGYSDPFGHLDIRVLPGPGTVEGSSDILNPDGCYDGGRPDLVCPLVIVPGFSFFTESGFNTITATFGDVIDMVQDIGYDVILLDYANGQDYIQRNGLAIREFLVNELPEWMDESRDCAALIGISMGTQTARYGMRSAEMAGEDHNIGLFISLDGPYQGANVPISLQATVDFLAPEIGDLQPYVNTLNSPAASQLLIKNRVWIPGWPWFPIYYQPKQEFTDYYAEVDAMGLPWDSRNIAVANGSGTGSLQNNGSVERILYADWNGPLWTGMKIDAKTDHNGQVFYGKIKKLFSSRTFKFSLGNADFIDIAPGGFSDFHTGFVGLAAQVDDDVTAYYELDQFDFIPTTSALGAPFNATFHHKCNTAHVVGMENEAISFIGGELLAHVLGFTPPPPVQYVNPCGQPEPGDPLPPTASCTATPNFGIGYVYSTLNGSGSSDPDGTIVDYAWDFDDGTYGLGVLTDHLFINDTDFTQWFVIKLTVTDDDGMTDTGFCTVTVECDDYNSPFECIH